MLTRFVFLATLALSFAAAAADPNASIAISDVNRSASATGGPMFVPNESYTESFVLANAGKANADSFTCDAAVNACFIVQVDVNLPADYATNHPTDTVRITLGWEPQVSDLDMHVYTAPYDTSTGAPFRKSRNNPPAPEAVEFPVTNGSSTYRVFVVPSAPAAISSTVTASIVTGPAPVSGGGVTLGGPTFANYTPPATLTTRLDDAGEPTIGTNKRNNNAYMIFHFDILEAVFNDATTPPTPTWRNLGTGGAPATADCFMTMDEFPLPDGRPNERIWLAQLLAATSYMAFTDDAKTFTNSTGPGQVHGVDNESIIVGPYPNNQKPVTARPDATYPHAMYYCSHDGVNAFCSRSDDGGFSFNPSRPIFPLDGSCGNHGHVKVGADGTVYVPMNNSCEGHEGVSISVDAGETFHYITVPGTVQGRWDSSIGIANDGKTIYYGYAETGDDRPMIVKGTLNKTDPANPTIDWQLPAIDVGAPAGLRNIVFSTVVAGDPDRAAFAFHGTTTPGNSGNQATFPADAEWYLWVATTFDGGKNWQLQNATPGDPTQRGSVCDQGTFCSNSPDDRNLLDFMDMDIDGQGRLVIGYADGCVEGCVTGLPNSYTSRGTIARQTSGQRMYAAFDPPPPASQPGSPSLSATRDSTGVNLGWTTPPAGASPIISYNVERATNGGAFRSIAAAAGTATKYADGTAIDPRATYDYRVSAVNSSGAGAPSNVVEPSLPAESICVAPGLTVLHDGTGDTAAVVTLAGQPVGPPAPALADLTLLTVSEPYVANGALALRFELSTAQGTTTLPPDTAWFVSFRNAANVAYAVRMVTDSTGVARFESYTVAADGNGNFRGDFVSGTPKAALAGSGYAPQTGLITVIVPAADVGVASSGESIRSLLAISTKLVSAGSDSFLSNPLDLMPNDGNGTGSVQTVPVATCGPNHAPVAVLQDSAIGPRKNLDVHFDASRSFDPDATSSDPQLRDSIAKYVFDFGDGTAPLATASPTVDHQYARGGQYAASLRVQDSRGKASESASIKQICEKCLKGP